MKNSIKTIVSFALSVLFAFNAVADDKETKTITGFGASVFTSKAGKVVLNVDKYNTTNMAILLEDINGKVIYQEMISARDTKFRRLLDVSQLPAGSYQLQIVSNGEKITKTLELSEQVSLQTIALR